MIPENEKTDGNSGRGKKICGLFSMRRKEK
jgi:hypothetical protein